MALSEDKLDELRQDALDEERADFEDFLRERDEVERWADNREWELAVGGR